jgi:hypothetical protein
LGKCSSQFSIARFFSRFSLELGVISVDPPKSAAKLLVLYLFLPGFLVLPVGVLTFNWQPGLNPVLFSSGVIAHVDVSHVRQFTGGLF